MADNPNNNTLPRISSAGAGNNKLKINNITKKNKRRNFSSSLKKGKNKYLPPKPLQYNYEFNKLKKENEYMISELERLNIELRSLIEKQQPLINKRNTSENRLDINKENEKNANKKYLRTLITEYNRVYKNLSIGQDRNKINNLKTKLNDLKRSYNDNMHVNKVLKSQIYKNEQQVEIFKKKREKSLINLNDYENKYILYKNKLKDLDKENERMKKLLIDEEKKIEDLKINYSKLEEILSYYEETQGSLKKKNDEEKKNKEMETKLKELIKKKDIWVHARLSMEKAYENKIEKQKKYINELNATLNEINNAIESLSDSDWIFLIYK